MSDKKISHTDEFDRLVKKAEQEVMELVNDKEMMSELRLSLDNGLLIAKNKPFVVNRYVVILTPKQKMFDWINGFTEGDKHHIPINLESDKDEYRRAYLISRYNDEVIKKEIRDKRNYFINEVTSGYCPKFAWAWEPKEDEFDEWFEVTIVEELWDLERSKIVKEPDEPSFDPYEFNKKIKRTV